MKPSLYIAGFAAVISMISLLWNIVNAIISRTARFRIDFRVVQQMITDPIIGLGNPTPFFDITITNTGAATRIINCPVFFFDKPKEGIIKSERRFQVISPAAPTTYPLELAVGRQHNYQIKASGFIGNFRGQLNPSEKVCIEVTDTHNKRYRSNKIRIRDVNTALDVAAKIADHNS